ncbi:Hypothetical protein CINCED_3A010038 [Cinara cedri]|uniref:Uncharacterized protein n=1 Tax=Cinara cedri TaxID=506608 RepID=A0A5E4NNN4_9HEMI|nr:Hypothetical protein CINCED_3A010038 [Cinara cedri]
MMTHLKKAVEEYNVKCKSSNTAAMKVLEDIETLLMKPIRHQLDECREIIFIDALGNIDKFSCKPLIYTNSCAGGLSIGTIILSNECDYGRKEQWALCFQKGLLTRGQNTNNISKAGMKMIKGVILERTKAYSLIQLFYFYSQ